MTEQETAALKDIVKDIAATYRENNKKPTTEEQSADFAEALYFAEVYEAKAGQKYGSYEMSGKRTKSGEPVEIRFPFVATALALAKQGKPLASVSSPSTQPQEGREGVPDYLLTPPNVEGLPQHKGRALTYAWQRDRMEFGLVYWRKSGKDNNKFASEIPGYEYPNIPPARVKLFSDEPRKERQPKPATGTEQKAGDASLVPAYTMPAPVLPPSEPRQLTRHDLPDNVMGLRIPRKSPDAPKSEIITVEAWEKLPRVEQFKYVPVIQASLFAV